MIPRPSVSRHYLRSKLPPLCLRWGSYKWTEEILQWIVHSLAHPDTPFCFQWLSYRVCIILDKQNIDVLAINETRLDDNISDLEVNVRGYDIIRRDRPLNGRSGGGVCFYIRSNINYSICKNLHNQLLEILSIEIRKPNWKPFASLHGIDLCILQWSFFLTLTLR